MKDIMSESVIDYDKDGSSTSDALPPRRRLSQPVPVTLLSGFLGAGKTTLLKRILHDRGQKMKIAVVVNDMGAMNLDADEIKRHKLVQEKAQMVEFHNGCICCTLRGDLLKTIKDLSQEVDESGNARWDYIVIESTGISEPLPIAQTFVMDVSSCGPVENAGEMKSKETKNAVDSFEPLSKYAELDTLVTVVDLYNVLNILGGEPDKSRAELVGDEEKNEGRPASLYQLLVDQLEFANVILLNKVDILHPESTEARYKKVMQVGRLVRKFNPDARILVSGYEWDFGKPASDKPVGGRLTKNMFKDFDVSKIINTKMFDMRKTQMSAGWIRELQRDMSGIGHTPETEEYGIGSFVWRSAYDDPRPLHPKRFSSILKGFGHLFPGPEDQEEEEGEEEKEPLGVFTGVVRSKGQLWLANCHAIKVDFHTAGRQVNLQGGTPFLSAVPRKHWDPSVWTEYLGYVQAGRWAGGLEGFGDRCSYLVIIGVELSAERKAIITKALNEALLTDEEMEAGKAAFLAGNDDTHPWRGYEDPFFGGKVADLWKLTFPGGEEKGNKDDEVNDVMNKLSEELGGNKASSKA